MASGVGGALRTNAGLYRLTPGEWLRRIKRLREPVKTRVACLVWWDYYSQRKDGAHWSNLDKYLLKPYVQVARWRIARGLVAAGYDAEWAKKRTSSAEYEVRVAGTGKIALYDRDSQAMTGVAIKAGREDECDARYSAQGGTAAA